MMRILLVFLALVGIITLTLTTDVADAWYLWYPACFLIGFAASYIGGELDDR